MALSISNISIELREILLKDRPVSLYETSPKGTVPVLQLHDKVIDESLDIMLWALKNNFEQTWLSKEHAKELKMININDTEFKRWLDRYKYCLL